jgi:hypothetical protein
MKNLAAIEPAPRVYKVIVCSSLAALVVGSLWSVATWRRDLPVPMNNPDVPKALQDCALADAIGSLESPLEAYLSVPHRMFVEGFGTDESIVVVRVSAKGDEVGRVAVSCATNQVKVLHK